MGITEENKTVHYINNSEFSKAVVAYVKTVKEEKDKGNLAPVVPNYIAVSFLKIAENLSHKANFIRYTYREEMVMDAVENCLKAIENYDINAPTRTGTPNAFAYFTQIIWYAFLRRITKEKKQQEIKEKYITESGFENFISTEDGDFIASSAASNFVDVLRTRIDKVKTNDKEIKDFAKKNKLNTRKKKVKDADSDLVEFLDEDEEDY
jgi:hypothetical protein